MIKSKANKYVDLVLAFICVVIILICLLPLLNILSRSLSSPDALIRNEVKLWPVGFSFDAYKTVLSDAKYPRSLIWTAVLTVICTVVSLVMTILCAYPLIHPNFKGKKFFNAMIIFTMYFSAGTIPNYLLMKDINFLDNPLVLIIPSCLSVFNMIILKSFFYGIPDSFRESAEIDGANPMTILIKIYIPLSTSVLATLALFYAVGRWNGYTDALMYVKTKEMFPIQLLLYNILNNVTSVEVATQEGFSAPGLSDSLKAATVMFATIPILCIYPWLQRFFITGVSLGGEKG